MTKKIIEKFIYEGLGFPYELHHVEMVKVHNETYPKINVKKVADQAIKSLVSQSSRLTGNQIKFIRTYFSKSLREFSEIVNESHMAIKKWEDFKNESTNMDLNIEIMLRLYIFNNIAVKSKKDIKGRLNFHSVYLNLRGMFSSQKIKKRYKVQDKAA